MILYSIRDVVQRKDVKHQKYILKNLLVTIYVRIHPFFYKFKSSFVENILILLNNSLIIANY